jgi:Ca2+-binding RTX toxin-like protein
MANVILTTDHFATVTLGASDVYFLSNDTVHVASGPIQSVVGADHQNVTVLGDLFSTDGAAIQLFDPFDANGYAKVQVGANGTVGTASTGAAVLISGPLSALSNAGLIFGGSGVHMTGANATVSNSGEIHSQDTTTGRFGVAHEGLNSTVVNTGLIESWDRGIWFLGAGAVLDNDGSIVARSGAGVRLNQGGQIDNSGVINSRLGDAIDVFGSATVWIQNRGEITSMSGNNALDCSTVTGRVFAENTGTIFGTLKLGANNDIFRGNHGLVSGFIIGGDGDDIIHSGWGDDLVNGGIGNDTVNGGLGDDDIYGSDGLDLLRGRAGDDLIYGDDGEDALYGGAGDDDLRGGKKADVLNGGRDADVLRGGGGADQFVFSRLAGDDRVADFTDGIDLIDLQAFGLRPADYDTQVLAALSNAGDGATFLDLAKLGGVGSVLIEGLRFANVDAGDFLL